MKFIVTLILFLAAVIYSCSPTSTTETTDESAEAVVVENPSATFSLWLELAVRESAMDKSKYLTSIYLGEHVTLTSDSAMDGTNSWHKIVMADGKSGWVRADFLAKRKIPAAFLSETNIFKRPDRAAITDHMFPSMDFVAADAPVNGWVHIRGKRADDKWFTEGYVEEASLTFDKNEVEFAILSKRMNETDNQTVRDAILSQIQSTPELQTTEFYRMMYYTGPAGDGEVEGDGGGEVQETVQDVETGDTYAIAGPPYAVSDVSDLVDSGEGKILNIFGKSEYWYIYNDEKYLLRETSAEAILETTLFYHCTEEYLSSRQTIKDKVIEVIPGDGYVPQ
jgi:uncharacterized protein YgiM (DUF1202 family)